MLFKIIFVFLLAMVLIALIGRAFFPSALPRAMQKRRVGGRCGTCGRPVVGKGPCDCGGKAE